MDASLTLPNGTGPSSGTLRIRRETGIRRAGCPFPSAFAGDQSSDAAPGSLDWMRSITEESVSVVTSPS